MTENEELELIELLEAEERDLSRKSHLEFMNYTWMKGENEPLLEGFHTRKICSAIDAAFENLRKGDSTYLLINVHYRAGKSDIVSRYLPPHFLGEFPDKEALQVTYQAGLTAKFASFARNIFRSARYKELYPNLGLSKESNAKSYWEIVDTETNEPTQGKLFGSGLFSGITGSGGHLIILDDYLAGRREAESKTMRDNGWDAFKDDLMTRQAPVAIVVVLATQWHWDDISGRIRREMEENPIFPRFNELVFPARSIDYKGEGNYPGEFLFLERYGKEWYNSQYATIGKYGAAALLDCNPSKRVGAILSMNGIVYHEVNDEEIPGWSDVQWARVWDLAHTKKQRNSDDPDWTSGSLLCFTNEDGDELPHLWIKHVYRTREKATKRDRQIKAFARKDGAYVKQGIESSIDSKDAYDYIQTALPAIPWDDIQIKGDKAVRAAPLEPLFETEGHVHVIRGAWNDDWIEEILSFDGTGAEHDDQIDNMSAAYLMLVKNKKTNTKALNEW